ncbi:MAG: SusC/RagA family TonB-linked outer membrane protein [Bacteroidales bacterium]
MKHGIFKNSKTLFCVLLSIVAPVGVMAQKVISVKGTVKDATGLPVIGANVIQKGTSNGAISDFDGNFELQLPDTATLVVSYIGYLTQELHPNTQQLQIVLKEDAVNLEEAVVIGYGAVKKSDATGSVIAIKPDKMNRGQTTNAQDLITGKVAGVNVVSNGGSPGGGATIRIRGGSSLNASNDPLIVIDGLPMDNDGIKGVSNFLSTINPNDIESFTVLKDASATAIYGSRASNGVIIITTKKGEAGSGPRVSYDGNVSVSTRRGEIKVLNGDEFRAMVKQMYGQDPNDKDGQKIVGMLGEGNTNWQDEIFRPAFGMDHNLTVTGGLKNMPYRFSFGYTNQDGILKTSEFERYTGSMTLNPSFFDNHLKVSLNAKGMIVNNRFANTGAIGAAIAMDPTQSVRDARELYDQFGGYFQWTQVDGNGNPIISNLAPKNPVALLEQKNDRSNAKSLIGNAQFDYKFHFLPDLRVNLNLGMDYSSGNQKYYADPQGSESTPRGREGWDKQTKTNKSLDFYLQYGKTINDHTFDLMGGYAWQHFYKEGNYGSDGVTESYNPEYKEYKTESYLVSFFGRANYNYAGKYLATLTLRRDGTSRFPVKNRWGLFPAVALGWKVNEEAFLKNVSWLSDLKLRLGYGVTGQQNLGLGDYPYIPSYVINQEGAMYPIGGIFFPLSRPEAYNTDLKWEETSTYNAGIDFGFLDNRISGSVEAYYRRTDNLLNEVVIPAGTNFNNRMISNVGSLENKGIEFSINAKPVVTNDFIWDLGYNITYNNNKITKLTNGNNDNYLVETGGISRGTGSTIQAHAVGQAASSFYVYEQVYDNNGKPIEGLFVDRNDDGVINSNDRYFHKKPAADVTMGLNSKFTYKNWDLGFSLRASLGNYVYNDVAANNAATRVYNEKGSNLTNIPLSAFDTNFTGLTDYYMSDYYIQNASFLRVDNITLGYSFRNLFNKGLMGRVYGTVSNPFVLTKYKGLDPEVGGGIDNNIYPRPMVSQIGVSLTF